jgi:phosphinothricin acetyltransferase
MKLVHCTHERHARKIVEIFNEAILNSTALFEYKPRSFESMAPWFKNKESGRFPVIGLESEQGELLGFASYGSFRAWPAYKYCVEHSVYVHKEYRGKSLGRTLMEKLILEAKAQDYHVMVGGIELTNAGSIALHQRLGFEHSGTIRHAGFKFGRWLDLGFYQLVLPTPAAPSEA